MKKTTLFSAILSLLFLCSAHLGAQGIKAFPAARRAGTPAQKSANLVPPLDTRDRGIPMFGATLKDSYGPLHYVKFWSKDAYEPTKIAPIDPDDIGLNTLQLRCGAWCGDMYLGYFVKVYTYTEQPACWAMVDFETGTVLELRNMEQTEEFAKWPTMYEMAYDNANDVIYVLGRSTEKVASNIYTVNKETGEYTLVHELDYYAWAMACDYEGNLYVIQGIPDADYEFYEGTQLNKLNPKDNFKNLLTHHLYDEGEEYIPNYTHTMDMHHDSNQLYWVGCDDTGYQTMFKIDPKSGEMEQTTTLGLNMVQGMFIPFKGADSREAAGYVTSLRANADDRYTLCDTLKWVNPTVNWRGDALGELHSVQIARGTEDNVVATLDATGKMGREMTWIDRQPESGYNTYYVTALRRSGEKGLVSSVKVFVGQDVPGAIENLTLTPEGDQMRLTWDAPKQGAAGKGYDQASLTYTVVRQPGNVVVAEGTKNTNLLDDGQIPYGTHYYEVTPFNAQGEGITVTSEERMFGMPFEPEYAEDFSIKENAQRWTVIDNELSGKTFHWSNLYQYYINETSTYGDNDDFLISPPLKLKGGCTYRITFNAVLGTPKEFYTFSITMGEEPTANGQNQMLGRFEDENEQIYYAPITRVVTAKVEKDGRYYIGFRDQSERSYEYFYLGVSGFKIEQVYENDLQAVGLGGDLELAQDTKANLTVKVLNPGSKAQTAYKVKVLDVTDGGNTLIGEAEGTATIEPDATVEVPVSVTSVASGKRMLVGVVELAGDENPGNDQSSEAMYEVQPKGSATWNVFINDESTANFHTTVPMSFLYKESTVEFNYAAEEVNKGGKICRLAFEYDSNEVTEPSEEVKLSIYMGHSSKTEYPELPTVSDFTPHTDLQLVHEGTVRVEPGTNNKMEFTLDNPFSYQSGKNLLIQVWKSGNVYADFPALFHVFNAETGIRRSLRYHSPEPFAYEDGQRVFSFNEIPVVYLAIADDGTGLTEQTVLGGGKIYYNAATRSIKLNGFAAQKVAVYGLTGKLLSMHTLNGQTEVGVQLPAGVYIVKATAANGTTKVQKIVANNE